MHGKGGTRENAEWPLKIDSFPLPVKNDYLHWVCHRDTLQQTAASWHKLTSVQSGHHIVPLLM